MNRFHTLSFVVYSLNNHNRRGSSARSRKYSHGASSPHAHSTRFLAVAAAAQAMTKVVLSDEDESSPAPVQPDASIFASL